MENNTVVSLHVHEFEAVSPAEGGSGFVREVETQLLPEPFVLPADEGVGLDVILHLLVDVWRRSVLHEHHYETHLFVLENL